MTVTTTRPTTIWTRTHRNGWTAIVSLDRSGTHSAGAHQGGFSGIHWAHGRIDKLEPAQAIADSDVPEHDCGKCKPWFAAIPG